ncbi:MAG: hypothetical protein IJ413_08900 [Bacteroides sp.]|nr:hypothetical protein [Bacteroides sp.]
MRKITIIGICLILTLIVLVSKSSLNKDEDYPISIERHIDSEEWVRDSINYIVDSTLQRQYIDEENLLKRITNHEIINIEQLYHIIEPILCKTWGDEEIIIQKPFRINQIDTIWIITGTLPRLKNGEDVLGGVFYMEVRKDGVLQKSIHSE